MFSFLSFWWTLLAKLQALLNRLTISNYTTPEVVLGLNVRLLDILGLLLFISFRWLRFIRYLFSLILFLNIWQIILLFILQQFSLNYLWPPWIFLNQLLISSPIHFLRLLRLWSSIFFVKRLLNLLLGRIWFYLALTPQIWMTVWSYARVLLISLRFNLIFLIFIFWSLFSCIWMLVSVFLRRRLFNIVVFRVKPNFSFSIFNCLWNY